MRKNRMSVFFAFISFLFVFISCKTTFDFRSEPDAVTQIVEDIHTKKIVCLSENHADIFPVYLLTNNLEKLYNAGLRYIFLEENSDNYINNSHELNLFIYPPWAQFGYKYEYILFEKEIMRINSLHKKDQIITIWPETGLTISDEDFYQDNYHVLNVRDKYAKETIIKIMDGTNKKALIFYGNMHGEILSDSQERKSLGSWLNDYFGSDFSTYDLQAFSSNNKRTIIYSDENNCKIISKEKLGKLINNNKFKQKFTHYGLYQNEIWGVPDSYVPEKSNLNYMITLLSDSKISTEKEINVWSKKSEQLLSIYYLKYHLGNKFDFDWNMPEEKLYQIIKNLKKNDLQSLPYSIKNLENYMKFLYSYGMLEDFCYSSSNNKVINLILENMTQAKKINPRDIWPQYWISYLETVKALHSSKKKDYDTALAAWNELLKNDLLYASPVLKSAYIIVSLCYEKTGNTEAARLYQNKADNINPLIDIDFKNYIYFGK